MCRSKERDAGARKEDDWRHRSRSRERRNHYEKDPERDTGHRDKRHRTEADQVGL